LKRKCSVIVAAFDAAEWIGEMLASFTAQLPLDGWEYELRLGVDACPVTADALDRLGVDYWLARSNVGAYVMRNSLLAIGGPAECYAIFDADDRMDPTYLSTLIPVAMEHGLAGSAKRVETEGKESEPLRRFGGGIVVFRADVLRALGGFAAARISGDFDFVLRANQAGFRIAVLDDAPLYTYRRLERSLTGNPDTAAGSPCRIRIEAEHDIARMRGGVKIDPVTVPLERISCQDRIAIDPNRVSVIIFTPSRDSFRLRNWQWLRPRWEGLGWQVVMVSTVPTVTYCKAALAHAGAVAASGDVLVFADADCLIRPRALLRAVAAVASGRHRWATPNTEVLRLTDQETVCLVDGGLPLPENQPYPGQDCGGLFVVSRDLWRESGGMDRRFNGWGGEDSALSIVLREMCPGWRPACREILWHLWHPEQPSKVPGQMASRSEGNTMLFRQYRECARNGGALALRKEANDQEVEMQVRITKNTRIDGRHVAEGTILEVGREEAFELSVIGVAVPDDGEAPPELQAAPPGPSIHPDGPLTHSHPAQAEGAARDAEAVADRPFKPRRRRRR
jgi:hypothetical protein